ncbi:minichromosome maintenance protein 2 [Scenedesmus sp. NREL 46B-D3]|nr:minichromosome maintenance protein 2 [Scenedesmus sp. NREL 46B-D3]
MDSYESAGLDNEVTEGGYEEALAAARMADEELEARDDAAGGRRGRKRMPGALEGVDAEQPQQQLAVCSMSAHAYQPLLAPLQGMHPALDLENQKGKVNEWLDNEPVANEVRRQFRKFLRTFKDDNGEALYMRVMENMVLANKQSLEVDWRHMHTMEAMRPVAAACADAPRKVLRLFDQAAAEQVLASYPQFESIHRSVHVRVTGLPVDDSIRDLRTWHLGNLIKVRGVVTRRSGVFPQLSVVRWDCGRCGAVMGPFVNQGDDTDSIKPKMCVACQAKGPFNVNASETVYQNYQKLTLQETPGSVPAGRLPRHKEVILLADLIDCARPGEEIEVTGIYCSGYDTLLNARNGFPVFSTHIEANFVSKATDAWNVYKLTDEDRQEIMKMANDPAISSRVMRSIAPSIYGHENIKMALALALFGGVEKQPTDSHRLRGDINVLLLGDPGTAKSQFLKYVEKTATRAVYTTGKGASAVGLTAGVHKDPVTKEWTLEGGALVLADKGVCLIDEFDKMNDQDRVSIHEAMEQQSISISKAGIVTQLQARCSVIAAANPLEGRYDPGRTFAENINLSDPILSRFDVLCVVRDIVDPVQDQRLAEFVVGSHARSHPEADEEDQQQPGQQQQQSDGTISQDMLRKYITFAKQQYRPAMSQSEFGSLQQVYSRLRKESYRSGGLPIAVRHLESMIRMSEAHARMHLRDRVTQEDVNLAIRVMVESFISTQKYSQQRELQRQLRQFIVTGADFHALLLHLLRELVREERNNMRLLGNMEDDITVPCRCLEDKAREVNITDTSGFYGSSLFSSSGFELDRSAGVIVYHC